MTGPIKLFQFFQKFNQWIGIDASQPNQKSNIATILNRSIFVLCSAQLMFSIAAFIVIEASSMFEFGLLVCMYLCAIVPIVIYLIFIWQYQNILEYIGNCENFIRKSKY